MNNDRCSVCGQPYQNLLRICERCRYVEPVYRVQADAPREAAEEIRKIYLWELVEHPRLLAAAWFAVTGAIPGGLILLLLINSDGTAQPLWIIPAWIATSVIAGIYGSVLGGAIFDPFEVGTGLQAFGRGCLVAGFSFVTFIFLLSLVVSLQSNLFDFATAFLAFMLYGSVLVGWAVLLIGGFSGWLLFRKYRSSLIS